MSKSKKFCEECFSELMKSGECIECDPIIGEVEIDKPKRKSRSDKWEPNISKNEKWFSVKSDYTAYKE